MRHLQRDDRTVDGNRPRAIEPLPEDFSQGRDDLILLVVGEVGVDGQADQTFIGCVGRWKPFLRDRDIHAHGVMMNRDVMNLDTNPTLPELSKDSTSIANLNGKQVVTMTRAI